MLLVGRTLFGLVLVAAGLLIELLHRLWARTIHRWLREDEH
jgi:hypothetical protein